MAHQEQRKLEKLVAYMSPARLATARKASRAAGARSLSSWASEVIEREARRQLRTGTIPRSYFETEGPADPEGTVRKAVREERESGL
jgi:hypothetical protein